MYSNTAYCINILLYVCVYCYIVILLYIYYNKENKDRQTSRKPGIDEQNAVVVGHESKQYERGQNMKDYLIIVDGLKVGIIPLTIDEVKALQADKGITIKAV